MRPEEMMARLEMLERQVRISGEELEKLKSDLVCEIEVIKADVTATKRFLTTALANGAGATCGPPGGGGARCGRRARRRGGARGDRTRLALGPLGPLGPLGSLGS